MTNKEKLDMSNALMHKQALADYVTKPEPLNPMYQAVLGAHPGLGPVLAGLNAAAQDSNVGTGWDHFRSILGSQAMGGTAGLVGSALLGKYFKFDPNKSLLKRTHLPNPLKRLKSTLSDHPEFMDDYGDFLEDIDITDLQPFFTPKKLMTGAGLAGGGGYTAFSKAKDQREEVLNNRSWLEKLVSKL